MADSEYLSIYKGSKIDETVTTVKNNDCKVKYGNIIGTLSDQADLQEEFNDKVDKTTKINEKPLTGDITLLPSDIGALPSSTTYGKTLGINDLKISLKDANSNILSTVEIPTYNQADLNNYLDQKASKDLNNLTTTGEAHFANPSLSNLNSTGNAKFANPSLSNLSDDGNKKLVPVGTVIWVAMTTPPTGYLPCNGGGISRTDYPDLFNKIGYTYGGSGDTFKVPLLTDNRFIEGSSTAGTYKDPGIPQHTHTISGTAASAGSHNHSYAAMVAATIYTGSGYDGSGSYIKADTSLDTGSAGAHTHTVSGSTGNAAALTGQTNLYKDTYTTVQPKSLTLLPCIKY